MLIRIVCSGSGSVHLFYIDPVAVLVFELIPGPVSVLIFQLIAVPVALPVTVSPSSPGILLLLAAAFLFLVLAMFALGERRILRTLVVSAISLACIYVVFQTAFSVVLPEGILKGVLR